MCIDDLLYNKLGRKKKKLRILLILKFIFIYMKDNVNYKIN